MFKLNKTPMPVWTIWKQFADNRATERLTACVGDQTAAMHVFDEEQKAAAAAADGWRIPVDVSIVMVRGTDPPPKREEQKMPDERFWFEMIQHPNFEYRRCWEGDDDDEG